MTRKIASEEKAKTGREDINERLHDAIDGLRKDVTRVEVWATALGSFTQPVPDYSPSKKFELGRTDTQAPKETENDASAPDQNDRKRG